MAVSYSTLYRFARAQCDFRPAAVTVRVADPPAGDAAEVDFGVLGRWTDPLTRRRRRVYGLLVTLCFSRYAFLAISLRQDLPAVLDGPEAAWTFFGGVVKRVQFTAPERAARIATRQLGTIGRIDDAGGLVIRLDSGRAMHVRSRSPRHLDHGYAVTSHSSQGATAERVLLHVDTGHAHEQLVNTRLAYVAISRARAEAEIYTNDARVLGRALGREVSKQAAIEIVEQHAQGIPVRTTSRDHELGRERTLAPPSLPPRRPSVPREHARGREL